MRRAAVHRTAVHRGGAMHVVGEAGRLTLRLGMRGDHPEVWHQSGAPVADLSRSDRQRSVIADGVVAHDHVRILMTHHLASGKRARGLVALIQVNGIAQGMRHRARLGAPNRRQRDAMRRAVVVLSGLLKIDWQDDGYRSRRQRRRNRARRAGRCLPQRRCWTPRFRGQSAPGSGHPWGGPDGSPDRGKRDRDGVRARRRRSPGS